MTYDFRSRCADTYQWYVQDNRPKRIVYGPYPTKEEAEAARLLTVDCALVDAAQKKWFHAGPKMLYGEPLSSATNLFVHTMGADDIEMLKHDPEGSGYKSFKIKPPSALKQHPSWKAKTPYQVEPHDAAMYYVTADRKYVFP